MLANGDRGDLLHGEIVEWALEHLLGVSQPARAPLRLTATQQAEYRGRYASEHGAPGAGSGVMTVEPADASVRIVPAESPSAAPQVPLELVFYTPDRANVAGGAPGFRAEFVRDAAGRVAWLRLRGRILARVE